MLFGIESHIGPDGVLISTGLSVTSSCRPNGLGFDANP